VEAEAEEAGVGADGGVGDGAIVGGFVEDADADLLFGELGGAAGDGFFDEEEEEGAELFGAVEGGAGDDAARQGEAFVDGRLG